MAGYITYWPQEQVKKLLRKRNGDIGPITVVFGSVHTKMPSIKSVKVGDTIYPVTIDHGDLCIMARLPVEQIEPAYQYLLREVGSLCGALVPKDAGYYDIKMPMKVHKCHQEPFNCCSETAASSVHGSTIEMRRIPKEKLSSLLFGPTKSKEKPLLLDADGNPKVISISSRIRRMSNETQQLFDSYFD